MLFGFNVTVHVTTNKRSMGLCSSPFLARRGNEHDRKNDFNAITRKKKKKGKIKIKQRRDKPTRHVNWKG